MNSYIEVLKNPTIGNIDKYINLHPDGIPEENILAILDYTVLNHNKNSLILFEGPFGDYLSRYNTDKHNFVQKCIDCNNEKTSLLVRKYYESNEIERYFLKNVGSKKNLHLYLDKTDSNANNQNDIFYMVYQIHRQVFKN